MGKTVRAGGMTAVLLFALSSCATSPASTDMAREAASTVACHGAYVADIDTSVPGDPTPEAAAAAWAKSVVAPAGAPTDEWKQADEQTVRSGDWIVGVSRTVPGGWVVSGLGCEVHQR